MHLITMAHLGEAQSVIQQLKLERMTPELFKNEEIVLLLTGEGPFEAATKTALILSKYPFSEIINIGIAGTLKDYNIGEILPIRTLYLVNDLKPAFKSFKAGSEGVDCLTSFERILSPEKAQMLKGLGHLVDREAWGVAMAAKTGGIPFKCYKMISDTAGTLSACELVKENAQEFSDKIAEFLKTIVSTSQTNEPEEKMALPGFHFTFTSSHQFKNLLKKLSLKENQESAKVINSLPLTELRLLEVSPKEKTRKLIEVMEKRLNPFKAILQDEKDKLQKSFAQHDFRIDIDPLWEKSKLTVSFEAGNDEELQMKALAFKTLSLQSFTKLMNGEIHVE